VIVDDFKNIGDRNDGELEKLRTATRSEGDEQNVDIVGGVRAIVEEKE
jgi:hypothetical protein